ESLGLDDIVNDVPHEAIRIRAPESGDVARIHVGSVLRLESEIAGGRLQSVRRHVPLDYVIGQNLEVRIDDVAPGDVDGRVIDRAFGEARGRPKRLRSFSATPQTKLHATLPGASDNVGEVESEAVVALDHIGVDLLDETDGLSERICLALLPAVDHAVHRRGVT